jgi:hypothetical protein
MDYIELGTALFCGPYVSFRIDDLPDGMNGKVVGPRKLFQGNPLTVFLGDLLVSHLQFHSIVGEFTPTLTPLFLDGDVKIYPLDVILQLIH